MEQFRSLQQYVTDPNLVSILREKAQEQIMASMNLSFAFKALCFMVLFFYVGALYLKTNQPRIDTISSRANPYQAIEYGNPNSSKDRVEEWKRNAWADWMAQLEDEWKNFNAQIEEEKKAWVEEKEGQWIMLLKHLQNKWLHFNPNIDTEYQIDMLGKSETWDERQWKMWISTEGKQLLELDLKRWFTNNEMIYCKWTIDEWNEWKNEKIKEWITCEWKESEDKYWSKYDDATAQTLPTAEKNQWFKWKERIYREGIEWKNWIAIKQSRYVNSNWNSWSEWKNEKRLEFNEWIEAFVELWIRQKQWLVWTDERKDFIYRQKVAAGVVGPNAYNTPVSSVASPVSSEATPGTSVASPLSSEATPGTSTEAPVAEPLTAESTTKKEEPAAEASSPVEPAQTEPVALEGASSSTSA